MTRRLARFLFLSFLLLVQGPAAARQPVDAVLEQAMQAFDVPGAAVVIVEGDRIVYQRAFGVIRRGRPEPVTLDTLFAAGSIAKSFTSAALATLVDEGRIGWDDRLSERLPEVAFADPFVTRELSLRDALSHRSGMASGAGDLLGWPQTDFTPAHKLAALRHLPLRRGFRARYGYSNLLYTAAGVLVARTSGLSWESFVRARFLEPLGMKDTATSEAQFSGRRVAWPHARLGGPLRGIGTVAPLPRIYGADGDSAGSLYASGPDLARWASLQLGRGQLGGRRYFSEAAALEMHSLQTPLRVRPTAGPFAPADPNFAGYGMGWFVRDYRGHKLVHHAGGTLGAVAQMTLVPGRNLGIILLTNSEETGFLRAVELALLDRYLALPPTDWITLQIQAEVRDRAEALAEAERARAALPAGRPTLPLAAYAGRYRDPWFGTVTVRSQGDGLAISFDGSPYLRGALEPAGGDTFRTRFEEPGMEDAYVTFRIDAGRVAGATATAMSPIADFSFDYRDLDLRREDR